MKKSNLLDSIFKVPHICQFIQLLYSFYKVYFYQDTLLQIRKSNFAFRTSCFISDLSISHQDILVYIRTSQNTLELPVSHQDVQFIIRTSRFILGHHISYQNALLAIRTSHFTLKRPVLFQVVLFHVRHPIGQYIYEIGHPNMKQDILISNKMF